LSVCIAEQVAVFLLAALQEVVDEGNANSVARPKAYMLAKSPADKDLLLFQGDPEKTDEGPVGFVEWNAPFMVSCFVRPSEASASPVDTTINEIRAQVEKKLRADPNCGGLTVDLRILSPEGFNLGKGTEGVTVNFQVVYRHREDDPYTQS